MPRFTYTFDEDGQPIRRTISAESESDARRQLAAQGISPSTLVEFTESAEQTRLGGTTTPLRAALTKLEHSSASIGGALDAYALELPYGKARGQLRRVAKDIRGRRVADALANESLPHREILWSVIAEQAEHNDPALFLNSVLTAARTHAQHGRRLWQTFAYPLFMLTLSLIVISFLLMTVVPVQRELVDGFGLEVPMMTRLLLNADQSLTAFLFLLLAAAIAMYLIPSTIYDGVLQWVPVVGRYRQCSALASFCRTAAALLNAGVSPAVAIEHAGRVPGRPLLTKAADHWAASLATDKSDETPYSNSVAATQVSLRARYPLLSTITYAISDEVPKAKQGDLLLSLANTYHMRGQRLLRWLEMIFEPILVLLLGAGIAFFFVCLIQPLISLVIGLS